jgi:uncharacterized protein (DUF697 family)
MAWRFAVQLPRLPAIGDISNAAREFVVAAEMYAAVTPAHWAPPGLVKLSLPRGRSVLLVSDELHMIDEKLDKSTIRKELIAAKQEISELGGLKSFRNGEWLLSLIKKSLINYFERATPEYFSAKYPNLDEDAIAKKTIDVAAANAAIFGGITGAVISADELIALFTGGEAGFGIPANIAIGFTAISAELLLITKIQLQLVARLAGLHGVPLDTSDPEDVLTILAFAFGGSVAELAGNEGMKIGGRLAGVTVKKYLTKEFLAATKRIARRLGYKLLRRTVFNSVVPFVSIVIGGVWNRKTTRVVGKMAIKHFQQKRLALRSAVLTAQPEADHT